jgi:hypothetical protein
MPNMSSQYNERESSPIISEQSVSSCFYAGISILFLFFDLEVEFRFYIITGEPMLVGSLNGMKMTSLLADPSLEMCTMLDLSFSMFKMNVGFFPSTWVWRLCWQLSVRHMKV